jgi:hypothetical protein
MGDQLGHDRHAHQGRRRGQGTLSQPAIGEFKNGRGEFYDQELFDGRMMRVRFLFGVCQGSRKCSAGVPMGSRPFAKAALLGGVVAATIDVGAASLINDRSIPFILHSIAGGLLAERSFAGGARTAILGLILQEGMGVSIAAIYVVASRFLPALTRHWALSGLLYGAVIFVVMNYVVVPLSAWRAVPAFSAWTLIGNLAAMFLFGVIVAFFSSHRTRNLPPD